MNPTSLSLFLFVFLFLAPERSTSQIVFDNFSDNNLNAFPTWSGDTSFWSVENGMLRSQGPAVSGTCIGLSTAFQPGDSMEWQFYADLKLATSANNYLEFCILEHSGQALVVKLGGTADEVSLFRRKAATDSLLVDGADKRLASSSSNKIMVRIRYTTGLWVLETNANIPEPLWVEEGRCTISFLPQTMGFRACYSSANSQNFWIDDVYAGPWRIDRDPPLLEYAFLEDSLTWRLVFNEAMDTASGFVGPGMNPIWLDARTAKCAVVLTGDSQALWLNGFRDLAGLALPDTLLTRLWQKPAFRELLISEFMADPSPPKGLPEVEWIELLWSGNEPLQLFGFRISDAGSSFSFPYREMPRGSRLLLTATGNCSLFATPCLELPFSGTFLNNSSDILTVLSRQGDTIERLAYYDDWYEDLSIEGGVTLERIDPFNFCIPDKDNFTACIAVAGGTPGVQNSVDQRLTDTLSPFVVSFKVHHAGLVEWELNEGVDVREVSFALNGKPVAPLVVTAERFQAVPAVPFADDPGVYLYWTVQNAQDCAGNRTAEIHDSFRYAIPVEPEPLDLMFTEVMFLPGRGQTAFFELQNRSARALDVSGLKLEYSGRQMLLSPVVLYPGELLILHGADSIAFYCPNTKVTGWKAPNKEEAQVCLRNVFGDLIDAFHYSDTFFTRPEEQLGGYSLERTDTAHNCSYPWLWQVSSDKGGSPGMVRHLERERTQEKFRLQTVYPVDRRRLLLRFSQPLHPGQQAELTLSPGNNVALLWESGGEDFRDWSVTWRDSLSDGEDYTLITDNLLNCELERTQARFSFSLAGSEADVVINELLFDPVGEEPDYVELYNRGHWAVDLKGYMLASMDADGSLEDPVSIAPEGFLLLPGSYVVISTRDQRLADRYGNYLEELVLETGSMPSFPNDEGRVTLLDSLHRVVDSFFYEDGMHASYLANTEGISLERIQPQGITNNPHNWTSASASKRFGTPGHQNSQYRAGGVGGEHWQLLSSTFSPDGDGFEDLAVLSYQNLEPASQVTVRIMALSGQLACEWFNNWPCGTEGIISWDGKDGYGQELPVGPYLLWIAWSDSSGKQKVEKKVLVKAAFLRD